MSEKTLDSARKRVVAVEKLIRFAGQFNEEINEYTDDGDGYEYLRGQIDLIIDAAGLPMEDHVRQEVRAAITKASDDFYRKVRAQ